MTILWPACILDGAMELVEHVLAAHNGRLPALLGAAAGLDPARATALLRGQIPLLARRLEAMAVADPDAMDALFDIMEAGEAEDYLDDIHALTSRAAVRDGEELLMHLYGSPAAAREALGEADTPAGVDPDLAARFFTFSAILTVAAMSRRWRREVRPLALATGEGNVGAGVAAGGLLGQVIAALMEGIVRGLKRALLPRRRRRTRYARRYRRHSRHARSGYRRHRRRRRRTRRGLEDILGEILKG